MKVYVTRHGLTPLNKQNKVNGEIDEPLSPEGLEQAKAIIPLIPKSVTHIYTSSLLRTRQTAETINTRYNVPIDIQTELMEIRMGSLAGKSWKEMENGQELKKQHRTVQFNYHPYGGEAVGEVQKRLLTFFKKINNAYKNEEVLLVTHGGIIRLMTLLEQEMLTEETVKHVTIFTYDLDKILHKSNK